MENTIQNTYASYLQTTGALSTKIAFASFGVGTLFFACYQLDSRHEYEYLLVGGFLYVLLAMLTNLMVLLNLLILFVSEPEHREFFAIKMLIVLANVPIAAFYLINMNLNPTF